jgi:hypothetical protein
LIIQWAEYDIPSVFEIIGSIDFALEDDGRGKGVPRMAVYTDRYYRYNRNLYVNELIPRLQNLTNQFCEADFTYQGIDRKLHYFTSVDFQMAIFIFGKKNPRLFKQFYKRLPIPSLPIHG